MPPSFFDTDIEKWNKKFESTIRQRTAYKTMYKKNDDKDKQFM